MSRPNTADRLRVKRGVSDWVSFGYVYFGLTYYSQGVIAAIQAASGGAARTVSGETNLSSTVAQTIILLGLLAAVIRRPIPYARLCAAVAPLLCIAGFALLSALWSPDPVRTLRRGTALFECILFGMFLYRTDGLDRTMARVARVCVAMAVLSLVAYVALPSIGRETALGYERALRGVFPQKNSMSECMLLGLCCLVGQPGEGAGWRRAGAALLLVSCLLLGRGASALVVAALVGVAALWLRLRGRPLLRLGLVFLVAWSAAAMAVALVGFSQDVMALVGRDLSLTGRVPLWQALLPEIARAPLLGHGYAAFWDATSPTVQMIWRYAGWEAPDAHSSYLDILLQLGVVGSGLYGWAWFRLFRRAVAARTDFPGASGIMIFAAAWLLVGSDEGVIPIPNLWVALFAVALLALTRHLALRTVVPESAPLLKPGLTLRA